MDLLANPATSVPYESGDTTPLTVLGPDGEVLGFMSSVMEFKYTWAPRALLANVGRGRQQVHQGGGGCLWCPE